GRQYTMPVLVMDGRRIGDSTAIISALEERFPERSLYPANRARALELEDWFDENVGPYARRWGFNTLLTEPEALRAFAVKQTEWAPFEIPTAAFAPFAKLFLNVRYSTEDEAGVEEAREKLVHGLDRLEAELDGEFLVGDKFSVADLTAASLFYPLVLPPEGPWRAMKTAAFLEVQDSVRDRPGFRWVEDTFRRWRRNGSV
ncbi:MAG: glutathione S-transferase, partial [Actinomycetota bacterium]|nr:glutathione S-transferase [Actinomycetota bacterium]